MSKHATINQPPEEHKHWTKQPGVVNALERFTEVWKHGQPMSMHYDTDTEDCVKDLLTDLIHYCELLAVQEELPGGFEEVLASARNHARAERKGK